MAKKSKILKIIGFAAAIAAVAVVLGFVGSIRSTASCEEIVVNISTKDSTHLVQKADVRAMLSRDIGVIVGEPLNQINMREIETKLTEMPHIKDAKVYETINKKLMLELEERSPLVRIFDRDGNTAIMDDEGLLMPRSKNAILRLPVITGHFSITDTSAAADSARTAIFNYAVEIASDSFWKAQIQETNITEVGDFVAYPQVGNHTINFGTSDEIKEKLNRLHIFYNKGMERSGWNKYSKINLKFKDQIVCTKK